jgi:hypothetical protein
MIVDEGEEEVDGSAFRPFLLTGGRTRSVGTDLAVEALVVTQLGADAGALSPEKALILDACRRPISIAEIAVTLSVPIGIARVLVSDLVVSDHVEVCATASTDDVALVRRLIAGVRAI